MPKISILLPAYKSDKLLDEVFIPGYKNISVPVELLIYDNGGNEEFLNRLKYRSDLNPKYYKVIGDGKNIGLNGALNALAEVASGEWFYLPHTDFYMLPGWDTALLEAVKNQPPSQLLLCSRSIEPVKGHTDYHIIENYGQEWHEFDEKKLLEAYENYNDNTILTGYRMPFFLHRSLWERMGGVDPLYFSYCTDDDLVQTAYDVGVRKFWVVYNSLVYHLQGKSNLQQSVDRDSNRPYVYFTEKWRKRGYLEARHPGQWHPELIPWYMKVR